MRKHLPISTLFVDIGGVLLTDGWGHAFRSLAVKTFDLNLKETEIRHRQNVDTYERGKLTLDEYIKRVVFYQGRRFSIDAFKKFMFSQSKPYPRMINLIAKLKNKYRLKIVVVSNEGRELNEYRIKTFKLDRFVDSYISSCYVHLCKPDEDIFRLALDIAHVNHKEVIYIDNTLMFIQIAQNIGIHGICHSGYESTQSELASSGLVLKDGFRERSEILG